MSDTEETPYNTDTESESSFIDDGDHSLADFVASRFPQTEIPETPETTETSYTSDILYTESDYESDESFSSVE